jgi:hypothetical protein
MYSPAELAELGLEPVEMGEQVDAVIIQADHREYATVAPGDFPGVKLLLDGRGITDPALWTGTPRMLLGAGSRPGTLTASR